MQLILYKDGIEVRRQYFRNKTERKRLFKKWMDDIKPLLNHYKFYIDVTF